jgi:hypothetical protein
MIVYARHRAVATGSDNAWDFDAVRKVVNVTNHRGRSFSVSVCSAKRPRFGAFGIVRYDVGTWMVMPVRYTSHDKGMLIVEQAPIDREVGKSPIALVAAPRSVDRELAALAP